MGILPKINFDKFLKINTDKENRKLGKTFLIDFTKKKMLKRDGKLISTEDERAIRMWIEKNLLTQKNKWRIYKATDYGMEYQENIQGHRFPTPFLEAEYIREIIETMAKHHRIQEVRGLDIQMKGHTLHTSFTVVLDDFSSFVWEGDLEL